MTGDLEIVYKHIDELIPYENNPRHNDEAVEYVANSIKEFNFKVPIVVDKNGVVVAGHTRLKAAKKLGIERIPCIVADDLTDEQIAAFRLADNKVGEIAEWDEELLHIELGDIDNIDMEQFGFTFDDVDEVPEELDDEEEKEIELINVKIEFKSRKEWDKVESQLREIVDTVDGVSITVGGGIL